MRIPTRSSLSALIVAGAAAPLPAATINIDFVDRILSTQASAVACGSDTANEHVVNQELRSLSLEVRVDRTCDAASADAVTRHLSALGTRSIHAAGECAANGAADPSSEVVASAFNLFQLDFVLDEPTSFTLSGVIRASVQAQGESRAGVAVQLSGPSGRIALYEILVQPGEDARDMPFLLTGDLEPGSYGIFASVQTRVDALAPPSMNAAGSFDYLFALTGCLGDLDADGQVGIADLAVLLANFGVQSGAAFEDGDFDADGDVDLSDLGRLLGAFGTICG